MRGRLVIGRVTKSERGIYERKLSEEDVLGVCRQLLEVNGARVFRAVERVPKCYRCGLWLGASEAGTPDLSGYFYRSGITPFWIEIKRPRGKRRAAQTIRIEQIQADGGIAFFVDSLESLCRELKQRGITLKGV